VKNKLLLILFIIVGTLGSSAIVFASTSDGTINSTYKYAWSEDIAWLNFGTTVGNVHVTDAALTGYIWSANYGWINLNPTQSGVKNNNEGTLSGYAWGENTGWINFAGVVINSSGEFTGTANGDITGVINFNSSTCLSCKVVTDWRPLSTRTVAPYCGDGICNNGEACNTCSADCGQCPGGGGGGGGGGGPPPPPVTQVVFSGRAYPMSKVTVLKDGQISITTIAGLDANFSVSLNSLSSGNYLFSVFSEDSQNRKSSSFNFQVAVTQGSVANITGIFLSPTIDVDKTEVKRGDNIVVLGQSVPEGEVTISINSEEEFFVKTKSDKDGVYLSYFDTSPLDLGQHAAKSKTAVAGLISSFSPSVGFKVGNKTTPKVPTKCPAKADLNGDCKVNLVDFSIAAFWYKRQLSESFAALEREKLNSDNKIDLVDFSIMAYYWTG
jgi:hypothetical protein